MKEDYMLRVLESYLIKLLMKQEQSIGLHGFRINLSQCPIQWLTCGNLRI